MMSWDVYLKNGDMYELSDKDLIHKIQNREIDIESLVKNEQMTEWQKLKDTEIYKSVAEIDVYSNTKTSDEEKTNLRKFKTVFNIKMGLAVFSFVFSILNVFLVMLFSYAGKIKMSEIDATKYNVIFVILIVTCGPAFFIQLFLIIDNWCSCRSWFNDLFNEHSSQEKKYVLWKYINTGVRLAKIGLVLLCLEIVYYKLIKVGIFEPLFFNEKFFYGMENIADSYSYWY